MKTTVEAGRLNEGGSTSFILVSKDTMPHGGSRLTRTNIRLAEYEFEGDKTSIV